jgi:phosphoribosylamine--glycine ligase
MVKFADDAACCVVMASNGYPQAYEKGFPITTDEDFGGILYVAGAKLGEDGAVLTNGGRVLGVVARAEKLEDAVAEAYKQVEKVHFDNAYYRKDIGAKALAAKEA